MHCVLADTGHVVRIRVATGRGSTVFSQTRMTKQPSQQQQNPAAAGGAFQSPTHAFTWLGRRGYVHKETEYGSILHDVQCRRWNLDDPKCLTVMMMSREI